MMILLAGVLGACSSMSVDDVYGDSFPAGFSNQEYMDIHPELRMMQVRDYVAEYNDQLKKDVGTEAFNAQKTADEAVLFANLTAVQQIYLDKFYCGGSAAVWDSAMQEYPIVQAQNAILAQDPNDKDAKAAKAACKNWNKVVDYVSAVNFVGVADDLTALQNIPVDYLAISQQYQMFGRTHGWAYRACRADEAANQDRRTMPIDSLQRSGVADPADFITDTNLYCRDAAGVDRVILQ